MPRTRLHSSLLASLLPFIDRIKSSLIADGSHSNVDSLAFSRCSRSFRNGSGAEGAGAPFSGLIWGGGWPRCDAESFGRRRPCGTQTRNWAYDISVASRLAALSFMPAAKRASISALAHATWPILVPGWVDGRERKLIKSDLLFLWRAFGVMSIDAACICSLN
jgi:hypothetical protein